MKDIFLHPAFVFDAHDGVIKCYEREGEEGGPILRSFEISAVFLQHIIENVNKDGSPEADTFRAFSKKLHMLAYETAEVWEKWCRALEVWARANQYTVEYDPDNRDIKLSSVCEGES